MKRKGEQDNKAQSKKSKTQSEIKAESAGSSSSSVQQRSKSVNDVLMKPNEPENKPAPGIPVDGKLLPVDGYFIPDGAESWLWKFAKLHKDYPGYFQCQLKGCLCWKAYTSVGNVQNHLSKGNHKKWWEANSPIEEKLQKEAGTSSGRTGTKLNMFLGKTKEALFNVFLALWIACNFRPMSCVDNHFFVDMIRALTHPKFTLPSRQAIRDEIVRQMGKIKIEV
jgi:hypothetical protein